MLATCLSTHAAQPVVAADSGFAAEGDAVASQHANLLFRFLTPDPPLPLNSAVGQNAPKSSFRHTAHDDCEGSKETSR